MASGEFWPWWLGGAAVAAIALVYPWLTQRLLGVSGLYDACINPRDSELTPTELLEALRAATNEEFGNAQQTLAGEPKLPDAPRTRAVFLIGIVSGAALSTLVGNRAIDPASLGSYFDAYFGGHSLVTGVVLIAAGVLIGFGTRLSGGCTSGHGISGVARLQPGSLLSTATFWLMALGVAWLLHLGFGS